MFTHNLVFAAPILIKPFAYCREFIRRGPVVTGMKLRWAYTDRPRQKPGPIKNFVGFS